MLLDSCEECGNEEMEETIRSRSQCLRELAAREVSAPGRNWYRTEDLVMAGLVIRPSKQAKMARIMESDMRSEIRIQQPMAIICLITKVPVPYDVMYGQSKSDIRGDNVSRIQLY